MRRPSGPAKWKSGFKLLLLSILFLTSTLTQAATEPALREARIRVDGMVCYSCSYGMEKACKSKKIGKSYQMDLAQGTFTVKLSPTETLPQPSQFQKIVENAGFTYREVEIMVEGAVVKTSESDRYGLLVPGIAESIPMKLDEEGQKLLGPLLDKTVRAKLRAVGKNQTAWQVSNIF